MAFLDKTGLQTLTNKLVQGDAIKVASSKGTTVKEVIDNIQRECESVALPNTMTLENRVSEFKVGQGRDIDVSKDIEESKIGIELKGQTWHNLFENKIFQRDYAKQSQGNWFIFYVNKDSVKKLKASTKYTLVVEVLEDTVQSSSIPTIWFGDCNDTRIYITNDKILMNPKLGMNYYTFTTVSDFNSRTSGFMVQFTKLITEGFLKIRLAILEGDYTQTPTEEMPKYFEDIKSSFEDKVVNINIQGKNLFDFNNKSISLETGVTYNKIGNKFEVSSDSTSKTYANAMISFPAELFEGKTVVLSCKSTQTNTSANPSVQIYYIDANHQNIYIGFWNRTTIHTFPDKINSDHVKLGLYPNNTNTSAIVNTIHVEDIMAEESKVKTDYEEAYNYSYKFDIKEPLRRLPNDAYDEIRNNNGQWELVRRTATAIINGTESWERSYSGWNNIVFCCSDNYFPGIRSIDVKTKNVIANTLPSLHIEALCSRLGNTGICSHNWSTKKLQVAIKDIDTVEELKAWFADNPTEIIYELTNPIITPIDPIEFNISQGATVSINSDIAPVSTYDAVLNRAGQIEQSISLIADLRNRVNTLESIYDSNLIATQYKLDNLKLNYELEREED